MSLTAKDVDEIMKLLEQSAFSELVLETGDLKIRLARSGISKANGSVPITAPIAPQSTPTPSPAVTVAPPPDGLADVTAPLLGVFYRAPRPGESPFVEVGQQVEEETIIGIVEVMKLMNSVRAGMRGEIVDIFAQNAALVEFGQPLMRVRLAG